MTQSVAKNLRGFTLIELAVVIAIVALILGALVVPLATQIQGRYVKETRETLGEIKEALIGYAITQGRLPCPDTDRDGLEDACGGVGSPTDVLEGFLPWQDLATPATDAWDHIYRYAVTREFTEFAIPGAQPADNQLDLTDISYANIAVNTRDDAKSPLALAVNVPAIVMSVGSNGAGGSLIGTVDVPFSTGADELANVFAITSTWTFAPPTFRSFMQRLHTPTAVGCNDAPGAQPYCEYDDIIIWISGPVIMNRMVQARWLP